MSQDVGMSIVDDTKDSDEAPSLNVGEDVMDDVEVDDDPLAEMLAQVMSLFSYVHKMQ